MNTNEMIDYTKLKYFFKRVILCYSLCSMNKLENSIKKF